MASKKVNSKNNDNGPKATARHAKIERTRQSEIESFKANIANDKHLARKYESKRKAEIRALPKEDRRDAKLELKESINKRKDAERRDREILGNMIVSEKIAKNVAKGESFNEEKWIAEGSKKSKGPKVDTIKATPVEMDVEETFEEISEGSTDDAEDILPSSDEEKVE